MKVLIVGCGNIGAFYDWDTDAVSTYVKAFYKLSADLSVYDPNLDTAAQVARRYGAQPLPAWDAVPLDAHDIVVISSPTPTHFEYLELLLTQRSPRLIICEKPVANDPIQLEKLAEAYQHGKVRVMVNFHRRFQPKMRELAQQIQQLASSAPCQTIVVNYQRGFHNNASHAIDFLSFVFNQPFEPSDVSFMNSIVDEFQRDPTMTVACNWNGAQVVFIGLAHAQFSLFEISFYFPRHVVVLRNGGHEVEFFSTPSQQGTFYPALHSEAVWTNAMANYMTEVAVHARQMLADKDMTDNFLGSINISQTIMAITQSVKR